MSKSIFIKKRKQTKLRKITYQIGVNVVGLPMFATHLIDGRKSKTITHL